MYKFKKTIRINGLNFDILAPSKNPLKKYDVYQGKNKITSFGGIKEDGTVYPQYKDKIGFYSDYDHLDKNRRKRYRQRHRNDYINDPTKAGYFSYHFLW